MAEQFAGRYYKHQKDGNTICLIAGRSAGGEFLQVITNENVWQYDSLEGFQASDHSLRVALPEIWGEVRYGPLRSLRSDIMGPFRHLPMQCRHEVVSMGHSLTGGFVVGGRRLDLTGGRGYIEGDRGRSFPKKYLWLHCNDFRRPLSIMASVADIPFCGVHFMGCICAVIHQGREYRLATYQGVKIAAADRRRLVLEQGNRCFVAEIDASRAHPLRAPKAGRMTDTIHESNCSAARFCLYENGRLLFDEESRNCSFECNL